MNLLILVFAWFQIAASSENVCQLELVRGPCRGLFERYGYDTTQGKCVPFNYGGCRGNANNFETRKECKMKCMKKIGRTPFPEVTTDGPLTTSKKEEDVCQMKIDEGPCRGIIERYGYDANKGKCVLFEYGGCKGNANNFETRRDCKMRCMKKIGRRTTPASVATTGGPENNVKFETTFAPQPEGFETTFEPQPEGFETTFAPQPEELGTTFAPQPEGFETTFEPRVTAEPVEATSRIQTDPCLMNLDRGPCRAIMRRYGYDATKGKCVRFEYGGCGGNENNFKTRRECKKQCLKPTRRSARLQNF